MGDVLLEANRAVAGIPGSFFRGWLGDDQAFADRPDRPRPAAIRSPAGLAGIQKIRVLDFGAHMGVIAHENQQVAFPAFRP
jgi:hypothetical protein